MAAQTDTNATVAVPEGDEATNGAGQLEERPLTLPPQGHAAETFFVENEGVLAESGSGRPAASPGDPPFHFSRMGPRTPPLPEATLRHLAVLMTKGGGGQTGVPAGYTYLGQFVDHDLTMDKTTVMFGSSVAPADMRQGRSPSLDLDSLYGGGPHDRRSERFFTPDGLKLKLGKADDGTPFDLPRAGDKALIPDHRNDENLAVAQTHLAFVRFHNRVVDELSDVPEGKRFAKARRAVVKHYQWMLRHDYLPRICDAAVVDDVFANGRKVFEPNAATGDFPTMPVEFAVAAFRLGHSMIRREYQWNSNFQDDPAALGRGTLVALFSFSGTSGDLSQANRLPSIWPIDWRRMYDFPAAGHPGLKAPAGRFNLAMRIDTRLVNPLDELPLGAIAARTKPKDALKRNLAFRNLVRGRMVKLASGQAMVLKLKDKGVPITALTKAQIVNGAGGTDLDELTPAERRAVAENTPLWFYVLREAELNGGRLTGVGARIVAETLHRAMQGSKASIVRDTAFKPRFGPDGDTFNMPDLLFFAFKGKKNLLSPVP